MATPNLPANLGIGPGILYWAPLLSTQPTDVTTAWAAAWLKIGYTKDGSTFSYEVKQEGIEVAEELDIVRYEQTGRTTGIAFDAAEDVIQQYRLMLNGITTSLLTGITTVTPNAASVAGTRVMIGWEAQDASMRWIGLQCSQQGKVDIKRQKAPNYATFGLNFMCEVPGGGGAPWKLLVNAART